VKILAIDTTFAACSVAVRDGDILLAHRFERMERGHAEALAPRKTEKLDLLLNVLYVLLEDVLLLAEKTGEIRNIDIQKDLQALASHVSFDWIRAAVKKVDDLGELVRRNIQKSIALDALVVELRQAV